MSWTSTVGLAVLGALLLACSPGPVRPSVPAVASRVDVAGDACPSAPDLRRAVWPVLSRHGAERSGLVVEVDTTPRRPAHVELQLRLLRPDGVVGLERSYAFPDGDCGSAADLVAAAVDRFLSTFPQWAEPEPPAPAVPEAWIEGTARGGLHALVAPLGAGAEMSFDLSYGRATNRIGGGVVALGSLPMRVGTGRFALSGLLAEASWTSQWSDVEVRAGLRGGGVLVWGMSFDDNESALLPWGEAALGLSRELAWGSVGVQAAASPWRHRAVTRGMTTHEQIPFVRVGLTVSVPLLGAK